MSHINLDKIIEMNEEILESASHKVQKAIMNKEWDCECFEVMNKTLWNLYNLKKMKSMEDKSSKVNLIPSSEMEHYKSIAHDISVTKIDPLEEPYYLHNEKGCQEFNNLYNKIAEEHGMEGAFAVLNLLSEHLRDIKILNNKAYSQIITKMKAMLSNM